MIIRRATSADLDALGRLGREGDQLDLPIAGQLVDQPFGALPPGGQQVVGKPRHDRQPAARGKSLRLDVEKVHDAGKTSPMKSIDSRGHRDTRRR